MKAVFRSVLLTILVVALFGCLSFRTGYEVQISGFGRPDSNNAPDKYLLLPAEKDISLNDLQFVEYARYVDYALAHRGYLKANSISDATEIVFVYYGIGNPQEHQYTFSLPASAEIDASSATTSNSFGIYGKWGSYGATTTYATSGTYFRYASLSAVDLAKWNENQQLVEVWRMEISSIGSSFDLRSVFPVMIAASENYLGRNTGKAIIRTMKDEDPEVVEMRSANTP